MKRLRFVSTSGDFTANRSEVKSYVQLECQTNLRNFNDVLRTVEDNDIFNVFHDSFASYIIHIL